MDLTQWMPINVLLFINNKTEILSQRLQAAKMKLIVSIVLLG